jgi:hypothetical protein
MKTLNRSKKAKPSPQIDWVMDPADVMEKVTAWVREHPAFRVAAGPQSDTQWLIVVSQGDRHVNTVISKTEFSRYAGTTQSYVGCVIDIAAAALCGVPVTAVVETPRPKWDQIDKPLDDEMGAWG